MTYALLALMVVALGAYGLIILILSREGWQSRELLWAVLPLALLGVLFAATLQTLGHRPLEAGSSNRAVVSGSPDCSAGSRTIKASLEPAGRCRGR